ncbi:MAG: hypothetical protein AB7V16_07240 [Vulcanibacillus sp.]
MKKYCVSVFNHCNEMILNDQIIFANDFWEANNKVEAILENSGYSPLYMTISIKEVERT